MIEIRLLGELEVQRDGATVPLPPSKKSRALLAYLVATGKPQLRDRICELLWEGPDDPRAELRWSLTKLRPLVDSHLIADRERIEFQAEGVTVDLQQFRRMIGHGIERASVHDLYRAAQLVRGELLDGLDLPSCYRFQQWLVGEREGLRQLHVGVLARLVERLGPGNEALTYARRRAMVDPFSEEAHIALIRTLSTLGRNQEALTQYEHCRMLFERELATLPSEAVEDARRSIGRRAKVEDSRPQLSDQRPVEEPLVGRKREREELEQAIESPDKVVFISGEPGIGKSRLLADLCARMRARGGSAFYGRAFAAEMIRPYGIWIDALAELGSLSNDLSDRSRLFEGVVEMLKRAGRSGAVIALDDLQWLDEASAALLHYVARALRGEPILIAVGARSGELEANAAAARVIRELGRDQRLIQLSLEPLTAEETRRLTEKVAPAAEIDRIVTESGGNPLFAIELARSSTSGGPLPETLDQVLNDRLAQLDLRAQELVPWAAALGRHFDLEILGRATGMPSGEMMVALETLERCAILRPTGSASSYDFSHDLIRHAAYQKLSGPRKWLVHRQIAQALQATHDPDGALAGEIVHHASLAGDPHLASTAACTAGQRCLRLFAYAEALAVARQGLQIAEALPDDVRIGIQLELLSVIVISRTSVKERVLWQPRIETLLEEARKRRLLREASLGAHLLALLHAEQEDFRGAANMTIESAEIIREADPATAAERIANTGRCLIFIQRDVQRGRLLLTEAEALAAQSGVEHAEIPLGLGYYFAHVGEEARAIPELERAYTIAAREQDHWREWIAVVRLVTLALERPDPQAALRYAERLRTIAAKMAGGSEGPITEVLTALARMISGESVDIERSLDLLREIDSKGDLAYALTYLAEFDLQRADSDSARRHAEEALAAAEAVDRASEAAVARSLLAEITGNRSFIDPILATATWDDLTKRAQDRLMKAAARLNIRPQPRKERKHGTHRPRTVL
jgi:DNA-binding SARP family transcriptional activator